MWQHDDATYQHCLLVSGLTANFARQLHFSDIDAKRLTRAALVHDVDKAKIPIEILNKAGPLDPDEIRVMRRHAEIGHDILVQSGSHELLAERPRPARDARDRAYAADPANQRLIDNARQRIRTARSNPVRLPVTEVGRRAVGEGAVAWGTVAREQPNNTIAQGMLARLTMAQTIGGILHTIGRRVDHLTTKENDMAITSAQMVKDLAVMNEAVSRTSDLLDGQTKQQFQDASGRYLETLANRIDLQRAQERGVEQLSRAEVESLVGANADRLIERAREVEAREVREAVSAARLADRAVEAERRQEGRAGRDPEVQRELRAERAIVAGTQQSAAREAREAAAAVEAARVLAEHPAQPLAPGLIQTDALAKLRAEQERVLREIEAGRSEAQAIKGQRMMRRDMALRPGTAPPSITSVNRSAMMDSEDALDGIGRAGDDRACRPQSTRARAPRAGRRHGRFYVLSIEETLFGDTALVREWGRIGTAGLR